MGILVWRILMAMKARIVEPHIFLYAYDHFSVLLIILLILLISK